MNEANRAKSEIGHVLLASGAVLDAVQAVEVVGDEFEEDWLVVLVAERCAFGWQDTSGRLLHIELRHPPACASVSGQAPVSGGACGIRWPAARRGMV